MKRLSLPLLTLATVCCHASDLTGSPQLLQMPQPPSVNQSARSQIQSSRSITARYVQAESADLFGYVIYSAERQNGMYAMDTQGEFELLWPEQYDSETMHPQNGWMADGKLNMLAYQFNWGTLEAYRHIVADFQTGETVSVTELPAEMKSTYFTACAYNPTDGRIYGYGSNDYGYSSFNSAPGNDITQAVSIRNTNWNEGCNALCYNPADNNLYGINGWGDFVRIDQTDGTQETLFPLPVGNINNSYRMGLAYLPTRNEYVWVAQFNDYTSAIYTIDVASKTCLLNTELSANELIPFLLTTDEGDMQAPMNPEFISADFFQDALSGTISYRLPSTTAGGNEITGDLEWTLSIDGSTVANGSGTPGQTVEITVGPVAQGTHVFALSASIGTHTGPSAKYVAWIGNDTPLQPTGVALSEGRVAWNAVTEGVHGGYLDLSAMTYEVYINDEFIGETDATEYLFEVNPLDPYGEHIAEVIAICNDLESAAGKSPAAVYGAPLELDVFFTPTRSESVAFKMIDAAGSGLNWNYSNDQFYISTSFSLTTDSWLITPPMYFSDNEEIYALEMDCMLSSFMGGETTLEAFIGTEPTVEAMTTPIVDAFTPASNAYARVRNIFSVPQAGNYYIGFRSVAAPLSNDTYMRNISVGNAFADNNAPAAVENLTATAAEKGVLSATVSFTMPMQTVLNADLDTDTELTATVTAGENTVTATGLPGQECAVEIETVQGLNQISVTCSAGGGDGAAATTEVFTGLDTPGKVTGIHSSVSADNMTATFTWEAPAEGANGHYFEPTGLTYQVYMRRGWSTITIATVEDGQPLECSYTAPEGSALNNFSLTIVAQNSVGAGTAAEMYAVLGTPYTLPMIEDFEDNSLHYTPMLLTRPDSRYYGSNVYYTSPYSLNPIFEKDGHMAWIGYTSVEGALGRLEMPKFSTLSTEGVPYADMEVWAGENCAEATVYGLTYGMAEPVAISTLQPAEGWIHWEFALPEVLHNKEWVQLILETAYPATDTYLMLYSYQFDFTTQVEMNSATGAANVLAEQGGIRLKGLKGQKVTVWNTGGMKCLDLMVADDDQRCRLDKGIYMVQTEGRIWKVAVR